MKKISKIILYVILVCIVIWVAYLSMSENEVDSRETEVITVSILPVKYLVERIVGNDFEIITLVPPGSGPETYEPTPQQLISVSKSIFLFTTGLIDFEKELTSRLSTGEFVDLSKDIELIEGTCSGAHHGHSHHNHGIDPHTWTSPRQLITMAANAYEAINKHYPDSVKYRDNYISLIASLEQADNYVAQQNSAEEPNTFFIYHPAFTYYSRDYHAIQVSLEDDGKEPSVERLKELVDIAKANRIDKIFYQKEFSRSSVEALSRELGAEPIEIDPLAEDIIKVIIDFTDMISQ